MYDFAGGGPVHVASGFAGLAFCLFVGPRKNVRDHIPHNLLNVYVATGLLWLGWLAFNGGSSFAPTPRAAIAAFNSMLSPSISALTWTIIDYIRLRKISGTFLLHHSFLMKHAHMDSGLSFCSGVIAGLVVITPGSGFVPPWASIVMGFLGGVATNGNVPPKECRYPLIFFVFFCRCLSTESLLEI